MHIIFINYYYFSTGAEWWAQQFGKSLPFLNWLPFLSGKTIHLYILYFCIMIILLPALHIPNILFCVYGDWRQLFCAFNHLLRKKY
jgi:hypothetical protein